MMRALVQLARNTDATAAVEAAIFLPIFLLFTIGITDLGSGMFLRTQINAATQSAGLVESLGSYVRLPREDYVVAPELGAQAGPMGSIALAMDAASAR